MGDVFDALAQDYGCENPDCPSGPHYIISPRNWPKCPICGHTQGTIVQKREIDNSMSMSEPNEDTCPRCGSPDCRDPDSKACSDNCIMRHQAERPQLEREAGERMVRRFAAWLDERWPGQWGKSIVMQERAERFLKEGA